jgi:predicted nucleic acid-binding protein
MIQSCVIDASIVADYVAAGIYTDHIAALMNRLEDQIDVCCPAYVLIETGNVLWKRIRSEGTPIEKAVRLLSDLRTVNISFYDDLELLPLALEIGAESGITIYDAMYLALAQKLACPLITADMRQAEAEKNIGLPLKSISDFTPPQEL